MDQKEIRRTLDEWAAGLEIDPKGLYAMYDEMLEDENGVHPQLEPGERMARALRRVRIRAKREHGPQAFVSGTVDAIVFGLSGLIDTTAKLRDEAIALWHQDPKQAVKLGVTNGKGQPIDTRKTFEGSGASNPFYGKPLREHNLIQLVSGIGQLTQDDAKLPPRVFVATIDKNDPKHESPPLFHRVKFSFSSYQDDDSIFSVKRVKDKQEEAVVGLRVRAPRGVKFEDLGPVDPMVAVRKYAPEMVVSLEALDEWATSATTARDKRLIAVEGDVQRMDLVPNEQTRNRRVQIDDGMDIKGFGTTAWIPDTIPIDFGEGSRVVVFGNARAGNPDTQFGASINANGVWAIPDYKVALPEGLLPLPEPADVPAELKEGQSAGEALGEPPELAHIEDSADAIFGKGKLEEPERGNAPPTEAEGLVMALIHAKQDSDGVMWTALQAHAEKLGLNRKAVEDATDALCQRGRVYEPKLGVFKTIAEPTKAELALYTKRGGA